MADGKGNIIDVQNYRGITVLVRHPIRMVYLHDALSSEGELTLTKAPESFCVRVVEVFTTKTKVCN